jgi:hypothetical protein
VLFLAGIGAQEWSGNGGWLKCVLNTETMPEWYKRAGVSSQYLARMRQHWMNYWLAHRHQLYALRRTNGPHSDLCRRYFLRALCHPWPFFRSATPLLLRDAYAQLPSPFQNMYRLVRRLLTRHSSPLSTLK